jgi:enoyl-CoA hydratase
MSKELTSEYRERAMIVRFTRPEIRNPLSVSVLEQIHLAMDTLTTRDDISKIVFTGSGEAFASGADLREIAALTPEGAEAFALKGQKLMARIAGLDIKTIAAVNGFCFGGALDLTLACKKRIASPHAVFSHPGVGLGIITGWGGTQRLPRLVGEAQALEIFMTARRVSADEALRIGLIDQIAAQPLSAALENAIS